MPAMLHPVIGGMFRIPVRLLVGRTGIPELLKDLTAQYHNPMTGSTTPVRLYRWSRSKQYLSIPRQYARDHFPELWTIALDRTIKPKVRPGVYTKPITPRNEAQSNFMEAIKAQIKQALVDNVIIDLQINAMTGTGKTVAAIKSIADLTIAPILVIVHQNRVKEQWRGSVHLKKGYKFFFGQKWTDEHIGVVQQELCDYAGRAVVIAMAPSLISREYPEEFYKQFGVIIIDEVHKFAAPMLGQIFEKFDAAVRITMTATHKKGSMGKTVDYHVGKPSIISKQKAMQPRVYQITNKMNVGFRKDDDNANTLRTLLGKSRLRNELLAQIIYQRGVGNGRNCLVLSDRTNQLLTLRKRLIKLGVPEEDIGVYVGSHQTTNWKAFARLKVGVDDSIIKRLGKSAPCADKKDAQIIADEWCAREDIEAAWQELEEAEHQPYFECGVQREMHKPTAEDYDHIENHCTVVLATYGIFDVAIDISRLDWGLEATPRSDVEQAVGRTLRIHEGKPTPVWNTVIDELTAYIEIDHFGQTVIQPYLFGTPLRLAKSRLKSYTRQNATFKRIGNPYDALSIQVG